MQSLDIYSMLAIKQTVQRLVVWKTIMLIWHHFNATADSLLTHKQLETHGCVPSTVATDALVLKQQTISTHSTK